MKKVFIIPAFLILMLIFPVFSSAVDLKLRAKKIYESGMSYYKNGKYESAIKDFDKLLKTYPKSNWAALALMQKGVYQFDQKGNTAEAIKLYSQFISSYPGHKKTPYVMIASADLKLTLSTSKMEMNAPLSIYLKVLSKYPGSLYAGEAAYKAAKIFRRMGDNKKALQNIKTVDYSFRKSRHYQDAILLKGKVFYGEGEYIEAARQFQELINYNPQAKQALKAKQYLQLLQKIHFDKTHKYKVNSAFFLEKVKSFDEPVSLYMNAYDQFAVYDRGTKKVHMYHLDGKYITGIDGLGSDYFYMSRSGSSFFYDNQGNINYSGQKVPIQIVSGSQYVVLKKPQGFLLDSFRNIYIIDDTLEHIFRFTSTVSFQTRFSKREFDEIITAEFDIFDRLYIIDDDFEGILIFNQTGADAGSLKAKGSNYTLEDPSLIRFDSLNNMYVYDDDTSTILTFDPKLKYIKTIRLALPIESLKDFVVSDAAEIIVLDSDDETIYKMY